MNKVKCDECGEKDETIRILRHVMKDLKKDLKVTEEDRDETKLGLQNMIAQYYKLKETLTEVIGIYEKLQYSNSHEYSMELNAREKMFTGADARRMDEIIKKVGLD